MINKKVSFCIICQNEETMISQCLNFLIKVADTIGGDIEFIIVDGGSTDKTLSILDSFATTTKYAFTVYHNPWPGFAGQLNYIAQKAQGEWIFSLAADEVLSDGIFLVINKLISAQNIYAYSFPKINLVCDTKHMADISDADPSIRLRRNLPNFEWKDNKGLENLFFNDNIVIQHPSHFTFDWQKYETESVLVHFDALRPINEKIRKFVAYSKAKGSYWFGKTEEEICTKVNQDKCSFDPSRQTCSGKQICPITKYYKELIFHADKIFQT